jgi:hypothetical protein
MQFQAWKCICQEAINHALAESVANEMCRKNTDGLLSPARRRDALPARRDRSEKKSEPQDAAGEAIGLVSGAAGDAASLAMGLASGEAAAGLASAEASGAGVSSDLVQAVAAKSIEKRARIRNFRITTS